MTEGFPGPEQEPEQEETLLFDLKTKLEKIGEKEKQLDQSRRLEVSPEKIAIFETIGEDVALVEELTFEGEEIRYSAGIFGAGEITDETLALIDKIEAERDISLDSPSLGEKALKRMLSVLENL